MKPAYRNFVPAVVAVALLASLPVAKNAEAQTAFSVAARGGTLGAGVEWKYTFRDEFSARLVVNQLDFDAKDDYEGNRYEGDLELSSYGIIGDWHPVGNGFRISAGLLANENEFRVRTAGNSYTFDDETYEGNARIQAEFDSVAPYIGLGWSSRKPIGWSFDFEIGALLQGDLELTGRGSATLTGSGGSTGACGFTVNDRGAATVTGSAAICTTIGTGTPATNFENDIETEHRELTDDLDALEVYPVLSFGAQYRF